MKALVVMLALAACADERELSGPCVACVADVHQPGILDPASPGFHGRVLAGRNWDFPLCATCHGADFGGGTSGVSCLGCHREGPTACTTCHGAGPTTRAHAIHASTGVACGECHTVPARWDAAGHIVGVALDAPAPVVFGALASIASPDRAGPPTWDGATCTNIYCHGAVLGAAGGGLATAPRWDSTSAPTCDRCHGAPPPSHARADCASCHPLTAHVDGVVQIGRVPGCSGCHGSPASAAPPVDLAGNTFTTAIGVGAHQSHLQGPSRLAAPIACATCHEVPTALESPGHIDSPGPARVTAALGWDRIAQTCTSAWCHGAARPRWTATGEVSCGSCHGIPPADASHSPAMTLASCASCHPGTVDVFGAIIINGTTSEHINGIVDLQ